MVKRLIFNMATTLDGFMAGPNGALDDVAPGPEAHQYANDLVRSASAMVFGRGMHETVAPFWDSVDLATLSTVEVEFAQVFGQTPRFVFSRTLDRVEANATIIRDDIAGRVAELKRQPGDGPLLLGCGPGLFATFVGLDLIDEYSFIVNPVLESRGKWLFDRLNQRVPLTLRETKIFDSSSVLLIYEPARRASRIDEPRPGRWNAAPPIDSSL